MLKKLELKNWKTHKQSEFEFQKGVNVIIGIMGAGKSSVLDAISFALFGTFPQLSSKRTSLHGLITNRPEKADEAEVSLSFIVDNDEYKVTRRITEKGSTAKLEKNSMLMQTQATKVTDEISELLKIDYDTFSRVIYSEQNGLDYFLDLTKGDRKHEIDHMLGLDSFATAEENSTTLINTIRTSIKYIEDSISKIDEKELNESFEKLNVEQKGTKKELEYVLKKEKEIAEELNIKKKEIEKLKIALNEKHKLNDEISKLQGTINTLSNEVNLLKSKNLNKNIFSKEYTKIKEDILKIKLHESKIRKEKDETSNKIGELNSKISINKKKLEEKKMLDAMLNKFNINDLEKKLENDKNDLNKSSSLIDSSLIKIKELEESIKELKGAGGKCPVCERPLDDEHKSKILNEKENMKKELNEYIEKNKQIVKEKNINIKNLDKHLNELNYAKKKLSEYINVDKLIIEDEDVLDKLKHYKETLEIDDKNINLELDKLNETKQNLESKLKDAERLEQYEEDLNKKKMMIEENITKLKSIEVDDNKIYALQNSITKESEIAAEIHTKIESNKKYLKNIELQIEEKQKQIQILNEQKASLKKRQDMIVGLNKFKTSLIDTEALLRGKLVSSINELMLQLWSRIYPYQDYSALRLTAEKDDYLLEINTSINNEWLQVDGIASGGERSIACLILRIALAMIIVPNLRWIILDEPTHNIDSNGISKIIDVFGNELPNIVEQVFIITHDDLLKQINLAKIYMLDRDKSKSAHTSVITL
ncbi:MAG: SMC family ATPase [Candidatus Marsarchaeota archaeon]|jgi:exonuclease SbcC|nr:SMC family ATPase [Candidatus Marsarchaeota archaeon]